jgi:hypothetical protein
MKLMCFSEKNIKSSFLKFQIFGSGFGIAQTNRLCWNGKIYFFCGSLSITFKHHIKKSRCDNGNFWRKKIRKMIKKKSEK